jgi:hypothetical protein
VERSSQGITIVPPQFYSILEELMALLSEEELGSEHMSVSGDSKGGEDHIMISKEAINGVEGARTVRLMGVIQGQDALMLVDSGSSHSFVSVDLAGRLNGVQLMEKAMRLKVANGRQTWCTKVFPRCSWWVQKHQFHSDFKVLPLGCYDVILGMDWLKEHSPMDVHCPVF